MNISEVRKLNRRFAQQEINDGTKSSNDHLETSNNSETATEILSGTSMTTSGTTTSSTEEKIFSTSGLTLPQTVADLTNTLELAAVPELETFRGIERFSNSVQNHSYEKSSTTSTKMPESHSLENATEEGEASMIAASSDMLPTFFRQLDGESPGADEPGQEETEFDGPIKFNGGGIVMDDAASVVGMSNTHFKALKSFLSINLGTERIK